jgi:ABC-type multidrug transport system fused ATPase/permease subunit
MLIVCVGPSITGIDSGSFGISETLFGHAPQYFPCSHILFFDMTPTGRILNRASTDQSVSDLEIAMRLGWVSFSVIQLLGTMAVMSQAAWQVFVIFVPVTAICIWYQQYYIPTARELLA